MNTIAELKYYPLFQQIGAASFAFFLAKGPLWTVVPI
jgi:hypothetical protein